MPIEQKLLYVRRMYEFLDRLITCFTTCRDFSGIKATGFDGRGL
jgi:ribosomal protein L5